MRLIWEWSAHGQESGDLHCCLCDTGFIDSQVRRQGDEVARAVAKGAYVVGGGGTIVDEMWPSSRPSIVLVLHVIVHGDVVAASVSVIVRAFDATTAPQRPQERPRLPLV
jgi:hypothetical protein